jgi:hypothetical protein
VQNKLLVFLLGALVGVALTAAHFTTYSPRMRVIDVCTGSHNEVWRLRNGVVVTWGVVEDVCDAVGVKL